MSGWSAKKIRELLKGSTMIILQILNIHEANDIILNSYSNQSPSLIKAIFGNGVIEGWAVYAQKE
jgi:hypothetical protein